MTDDSATASLAQDRPRGGLLAGFIVSAGQRMLNWEPEGSLLVVLPNGGAVRFGRGSGDEALLRLHNFSVVGKAIRRGSLGFAEAYLAGDIDSPDLVRLFRFFVRNREQLLATGRRLFKSRFADRMRHRLRRNSKTGSRENIAEHYDLGNDFFRLWLTPDLFYSSGYFASAAATLGEAQEAKAALVLDALRVERGHEMLEIGSGWGGLSLRAARNYGARARGVTLSREQLAYARENAAAAGFAQTCRFELRDYRDLAGQYDRIASVEMIEAVGEENWPAYFQTLHDRLKPGGIAALQAITIDEAIFDDYRRRADFIQRHIFPGGMLPTKTALALHAERAGLHFEPLQTFGRSYARTLREWRRSFEANWPEVARLGFDTRFRRKWRYYLAYCEAGFLEGSIDVGVYRLTRSALSAS